jgi:ethanolamine ammonia-lyase large subunit
LDLRLTFVLANEFKEGDLLVGGSDDARVRDDARHALESLRLGEIVPAAFVDDGVTEALERSLNAQSLADVSRLTVAELKRILLSPAGAGWIQSYRSGLRSEVIAAVVKVMTDAELSIVARAIFNPLPGESYARLKGSRSSPLKGAHSGPFKSSRSSDAGTTVGSPQHFGSRIQPNSPGDDEDDILLSILEGLTYGCGDVIIGLNPASDDVEAIVRLEHLLRRVVERLQLPTRYCVLSDIVKQTRARERAPVDVGFQSLAGTSKALAGMVGLDVDGILDLTRGFDGCYFETGQGSAVTNGAAEGVDMVTLEARAYGVARHIQGTTGAWTIVNDVAGFIGPEVFRTAEQLQRACLEDVVMAKLHGLTMGLDVCATFHMGIAPAALQETTRRIVELAAPAYLMAVAGNSDPMLGYLTTSFREHPQLRRRSGRHITSAMRTQLAALDAVPPDGEVPHPRAGAQATAALYAVYVKEGGDRRTTDALREEGAVKVDRLRARGFDIGYGHDAEHAATPAVRARMETIYAQARRALYAVLDAGVVRAASPHHIRVRTASRDREEYLGHPRSGESIRDEDAERIRALVASGASRLPQVQIVISDGLNANALNESLRAVLPPLRHELAAGGLHVGDVDVVIQNGRVRAGYHVGALVDADAVVHFIGERPGTGLDTLSAYLTYGRDPAGQSRWSADLDHAATTAVCGIHRQGKAPSEAVGEVARLLRRILETRRSGVALGAAS